MEKVIKDGKVAVCFSPNYGAGWSTWANEEQRETLLFHPAIVNMVLNKKQEEITKEWMAKNLGEEYKDVYLGGVYNLEVEWIDEGTLFRIHEYDGYESVEYYNIEDYFIAKNIATMKLKMVTGCMTDSLTINGKEEIDLTNDERVDVWNKVCEYLIANGKHRYLNEFLQFVLTHHGEYGCSTEPCEQCGDYVETYKLEI